MLFGFSSLCFPFHGFQESGVRVYGSRVVDFGAKVSGSRMQSWMISVLDLVSVSAWACHSRRQSSGSEVEFRV